MIYFWWLECFNYHSTRIPNTDFKNIMIFAFIFLNRNDLLDSFIFLNIANLFINMANCLMLRKLWIKMGLNVFWLHCYYFTKLNNPICYFRDNLVFSWMSIDYIWDYVWKLSLIELNACMCYQIFGAIHFNEHWYVWNLQSCLVMNASKFL